MAGKKVAGVMHFLDSLGAGTKTEEAAPSRVAVGDIAPDPSHPQPRTEFDQVALDNLAESIREAGVITAITVRPSGRSSPAYYIVDGERRWRAAQLAELQEVPVLIRLDINEDASFQFAMQVMANAQAEHLSDHELAKAIKQIVGDEGARHGIKKKIAAMTNKTPAQVSRLLAMLDADIEPLVNEGLLRNAASVAAFNALDADTRAQLVGQARDRGEPLTITELRDVGKKSDTGSTDTDTDPEAAARGNADLPAGDDETEQDHGSSPGGAGSNDDDNEPPEAGQGAAAGSTKSAQSSGRQSEPGATRDKAVKVKLTAEKVESLFRFFVDKSTDKVEISMPRDLAIAVLENMNIELPDDVDAYATRIKDFLE